jgi:hypothetical protein
LYWFGPPEGDRHERQLLLDLRGHVEPGEEGSREVVREDLVVEDVDGGADRGLAPDAFVE